MSELAESALVDRGLVTRAQAGDPGAAAELFSRYWRPARAAAFAVTGEWFAAEDAASEGLRQALAGLAALEDPARFAPWLRTIVVRQARAQRPKARGPGVDQLHLVADSAPRPDTLVEREEQSRLLRRAVKELPRHLREAVALIYLEGYDSKSAAHFLNVPPGTLRRRLHQGRQAMRQTVERIFNRSTPRNGDRCRKLDQLRQRILAGDLYGPLRDAFSLRPSPEEAATLWSALKPPIDIRATAQLAMEQLRSAHAQDPAILAAAEAIRVSLDSFPEGASLHFSQALVRLDERGAYRSVFEHLRDSHDVESFRAAPERFHISNVLDLKWFGPEPIDLRTVHEMVERLCAATLPQQAIRISSYDEPRYRAALQLHFDGYPARALLGGILKPWPSKPSGQDAAHLRIFLEPWAQSISGVTIRPAPLPGSFATRPQT